MAEQLNGVAQRDVDGRVAVYIDFDNIVISRYDEVNGKGQFSRDHARTHRSTDKNADTEVSKRLAAAQVDVGALIDFAASFGTIVLTRAYADWSAPINSDYRAQLVARAIDLVQLFPAAANAKNGADIRLAVDTVEDLFRLPDLTHVLIVAGDSDYVPLAQRCKRLGRYVVGIGVSGATARSLAGACDEFYSYETLPGVEAPAIPEAPEAPEIPEAPATPAPVEDAAAPGQSAKTSKRGKAKQEESEAEASDPQADATGLLRRALRIGHEKGDADWLYLAEVKNQMKRMDPSFSEKALGFRSFSDFVKSRAKVAELDESDNVRMIRLRSRK